VHLWVVKTLEPLPSPEGTVRLARAGLVARMAAARGWRVTWWNSRHDRITGMPRRPEEIAATRALGIEPELLDGPAYRRAISVRRFLHDFATAGDFARRVRGRAPPDVIYCCMPPIELTAVVVHWARRHGVPVAVDVRDIWPDLWTELAPPGLRAAARLLAVPYRRLLSGALARADALFACGTRALDWALALAGRGIRPADGVFPHAVPMDPLPAAVLREAESFWEERGLSRRRGCGERLRIVFAGSLTERAGCLAFLREFLALPTRIREGVRVIVAGRGEQAAAVTELAAREPAITWVDWLDRARLRVLYERCDIGVAPYLRTSEMGWILVNKFGEYLAHGLPVLTTLTGEVEAFVREHACGLVWSPGRREELADRIETLCRPARLTALKEAARRVGPRFAADRVYAGLLDRLSELAGDGQKDEGPDARGPCGGFVPSSA